MTENDKQNPTHFRGVRRCQAMTLDGSWKYVHVYDVMPPGSTVAVAHTPGIYRTKTGPLYTYWFVANGDKEEVIPCPSVEGFWTQFWDWAEAEHNFPSPERNETYGIS
jgi:hypothetical protein